MTLTTAKTLSTEGKKDVQKLQRAIIDGLENVKGQNIQVFDTEHITSLFERVILASGTSNRQTKALAASVRDAVRDAGFTKPRIEGEDNGEWIIVDCGSAVAHIMQPTIRQYYNLEELWGDKPVKPKLGAPVPLPKAEPQAVELHPASKSKSRTATKSSSLTKKKSAEIFPESTKVARTDDGTYVGRVGKTNDWTAKRNASMPVAESEEKPARARKTVKSARPETRSDVSKPAAKKAPVKKAIVKIPAAKKVTAGKAATASAPRKPAPRKPAAKKPVPRSE